MLTALKHRAKTGFGFISEDQREEGRSVGEFAKLRTDFIVGYTRSSVNDKQFDKGAFHGEFYGPDDERDHLEEISNEANNVSNMGLRLGCIDGAYAFILRTSNGAVIGRDPLGIRPLYIARQGKAVYLATEVKSLLAIGIEGWNSFPPGKLLVYDRLSSKTRIFNSIDYSKVKAGHTSRRLLSLIESSVRARTCYAGKRVAIAFSGGIDSVLLSSIMSSFCEVQPICVSVSRSVDEINAKKAANILGLDLDLVEIDDTALPQISDEVRKRIEVGGLMNLSIGVVLREAAKRAHELGFKFIFLGQLADELFGGYSKYLALRRNSRTLRRTLYDDVINAHTSNFDRDDKTTAPYARTILPYTYLPLVRYSMSIPLSDKIDPASGQRKKCLREAAMLAGVPEQLALQEKKAMQYGSGVQKLVKRLRVSEVTLISN